MSDEFKLNTALAFDEDKQSAILGWALVDNVFFMQAANSIKSDWFANPYALKVWAACLKIYGQYGRRPTGKELKSYLPFQQEDGPTQKKIAEVISRAVQSTKVYGVDMLREEVTAWMKAVIFAQGVQQAVINYNAQKVDAAWSILESALVQRSTASFEEGVNQGFRPSAERILQEREERLVQAKRVLPFSVGYLDDTLGGIIPNDLIVLGAKTGAGKTQLATSISLGASLAGYPVYYYALEAEQDEVERRIKYGLLSNEFRRRLKAQGLQVPPISYTDWRLGKIEDKLGPLEDDIREDLVKSVKNINTLYRTSGQFGLDALERSMMQIVDKARLIIVDHLHYVDTEGDDENSGYKRVIKCIRDIVLRYGVPVIVIAHLRKTQGGRAGATLLPLIEEFHGTSDVPKISTTCIMLSPAFDHLQPEPYLWPTYIGVVKSRLDGSRTRFSGLVNFDSNTSRYEEKYRIGKMEEMGRVWTELYGAAVPYWATKNDSKEPPLTTSVLE